MTLIAIDASRAFLKRRTGIEEYSYQVIKHLRNEFAEERIVLYVRKKLEIGNWKLEITNPSIDFSIPQNWRIRAMWGPRLWTQVRLSLQMLLDKPEVLFVPAHTVPFIHAPRTVVVVHGLEYEFCPEGYSFLGRLYMRWSIRYSCRVAERIIAVSENTKKDLMRLYHVPEEKICVISEGYNTTVIPAKLALDFDRGAGIQEVSGILDPRLRGDDKQVPFFLFIGRLEQRKNIVRMIEAFEMFKQKTGLPHTLVLAGKPGFGYEKIRFKIQNSKFKIPILELGYVSEEEKWSLLKSAEAFLFPSLYEGFGLPILEAQAAGVPVITSNTSSLPEVAGTGAVFVDPLNVQELSEAMERMVSDSSLKNAIIEAGRKNVARFSWEKCARELAEILKTPYGAQSRKEKIAENRSST